MLDERMCAQRHVCVSTAGQSTFQKGVQGPQNFPQHSNHSG